ncbi:hypothetical protein Glove_99g354 [Diversispora epigaea]|uniref:Uncharacterized protein n=1 Tax=Diversispora epigaea TaxID=1348612 RepID=A0A397J8M0_9GLOM|nr:hypothetical protein Glove_99g354 [Diversispora epigaea]
MGSNPMSPGGNGMGFGPLSLLGGGVKSNNTGPKSNNNNNNPQQSGSKSPMPTAPSNSISKSLSPAGGTPGGIVLHHLQEVLILHQPKAPPPDVRGKKKKKPIS